MADQLEDAAAALTAALGRQEVGPSCASALRALLPGATFLRASVRCGAGLFVSDDLLQPGHIALAVASLRNSLAGMAMAQRQPVAVTAAAAAGGSAAAQQPSTTHVLCVPAGLRSEHAAAPERGSSQPARSAAPPASGSRHLYVGALMVGCQAAAPPPALCSALASLADAAAPYLLLLGLTKVADMADLLRLRAADCSCCSDEEDHLQDVPLEACAPPLPRGGDGGAAAGAMAAAHAALAKRSRLAPRGSSGEGTSSATRAAERRASSEEEGEADPKAALKAQRGSRVAAAPPPPPPAGLLLRYADPALEARFAAAQNAGLARGDGLFATLHLAAALCLGVLHAGALMRSAALQAFLVVLATPLATMLLDPPSYHRYREALLAAVLVSHAMLLRFATLPSLLRMLPGASLPPLPWLLRATGAEALAVFPLGFKLRFRLFLPVQLLCLALAGSSLPLACSSPVDAAGCLPLLEGRAAHLLLALGGMVPALALYRFELRARRRFQATATALDAL